MIHRMLAIWSQLNFTLQQCSMKEERSDILKNHRGNILPLLFTYIFSSLFLSTNLRVEIEKFAGSLGPLLQIETTNAKQELTIWKLYKCSTWKNGCLTIGKIPWRRKWQSTPVLLLREAYGQRSLADCSPWDPKESDTTQWLKHSNSHCMGTARTMVLAKTKRCPKSSKSF